MLLWECIYFFGKLAFMSRGRGVSFFLWAWSDFSYTTLYVTPRDELLLSVAFIRFFEQRTKDLV